MTRSILKAAAMPLGAVLLLGACAAPSTTTMPADSMAMRIGCGGSADGMNICFERAGKACGAAGYSIVGEDGRVIASVNADSGAEALQQAWEYDTNSILVICNK